MEWRKFVRMSRYDVAKYDNRMFMLLPVSMIAFLAFAGSAKAEPTYAELKAAGERGDNAIRSTTCRLNMRSMSSGKEKIPRHQRNYRISKF